MTSLRWPRLVGAVLLAAAAQTAYAQAPTTQAWPERTIQAVVPFAAGAANDIVGGIADGGFGHRAAN